MAQIAVIRQQYRPDGGAEKFVASMLAAFDGSDHELSVITRRWPGRGSSYRVIECKTRAISRAAKARQFCSGVQSVLQKEKFDIVQSNERIPGCDIFRAGDGVHASWLKQRFRTISKARQTYVALSSFHRYMVAIERRMFEDPRLKVVICNSKFVRDEIANRFDIAPEKLRVVYNCIDLNRFTAEPDPQRQQLRSSLNISPDDSAFIFVGSGFERKGVARAIRAIAATKSHLIVVGRDKAEKNYKKLATSKNAADRIHFVGMQSDVQPWYKAADALILPTLYDPFPNVILEAMASGLPVITTTKCGGADIIQNSLNGYICDALDHDAHINAIRKLEDPAHRQACAANARLSVEPFTEHRMKTQLSAIYREHLSASRSRAA